MAKKLYEPEVIQETPFPGEVEISDSLRSGSKNTYTPTTTNGRPFKQKRTSIELLSTALNTRSRKILQEFELEQSGGLKVGNFEEGVTGDLRITPSGITARDIAGITTFAIDGSDGSAVFRGTLRAGSTIVADTIVNEQASSGNGRTVYYNDGIPAILIGDPS
jgi:hypothetical protein